MSWCMAVSPNRPLTTPSPFPPAVLQGGAARNRGAQPGAGGGEERGWRGTRGWEGTRGWGPHGAGGRKRGWRRENTRSHAPARTSPHVPPGATGGAGPARGGAGTGRAGQGGLPLAPWVRGPVRVSEGRSVCPCVRVPGGRCRCGRRGAGRWPCCPRWSAAGPTPCCRSRTWCCWAASSAPCSSPSSSWPSASTSRSGGGSGAGGVPPARPRDALTRGARPFAHAASPGSPRGSQLGPRPPPAVHRRPGWVRAGSAEGTFLPNRSETASLIRSHMLQSVPAHVRDWPRRLLPSTPRNHPGLA